MSNNNNHKIRHGAAKEHGKAHQEDHKKWTRRSFLRGMGLTGGAGLLLGGTPVSALAASPFGYLLNNAVEDRTLVLIRLGGGNDGLNTFVPLYDYGTYQSYRPNIALPQNSLINLGDEFGMHGAMDNLYPLWQEGQMKVVNNVGYENHNLSHFRSTDIWGSASDSDVVDNSGWMGRFLENEFPAFITDAPPKPPAVQIGSVGSLVFDGSDENFTSYAVSVTSPDDLFEIAQTGQLYPTENLPDCYYGDQLEYMRIVTNTTFRYAEVIKEAYDNSTNEVDYSENQVNIGAQLALVARLIKGGLGTKIYMVTLDGFDTHAGQLANHDRLLRGLAGGVSNFFADLGEDLGKDVLCMTFSEFGRRVNQNASQGTDHGTAAPLMLFGQGLNGNGFLGENPDLQNLDNNSNLQFSTDFREIYASVLENWLCIDGDLVDNILGQSFNRIDLGLTCNPVVSSPSLPGYTGIQHQARYGRDGQIHIHYNLPNTMYTKVEVFSILGQPIALLQQGRQAGGEHQVHFQSNSRYAPANYIYRIEANGQAYSGKIVVGIR